jgi:hypothetical protein
MRAFCLSLLIAVGSLMVVSRPMTVAADSNHAVHDGMVVALQTGANANPVKDITVDVNVNHGHAWYRSPVWIAIGVIAVVLLVVIVAMISRGGGTTIIKE